MTYCARQNEYMYDYTKTSKSRFIKYFMKILFHAGLWKTWMKGPEDQSCTDSEQKKKKEQFINKNIKKWDVNNANIFVF